MLFLIGFLLVLILVSVIFVMPALWGRAIYGRYSGSRAVTCPENGQKVAVSFDALHAAWTGVKRAPQLQLSDCTRWPERRKCGQECIPGALRAEPYTKDEVEVKSKRIYHLPVLLAAFAGWYVGAFWHSHFLFRSRWMADLGLSPDQVKSLVQWYSPHLLTAAVCLLFAYGVAWLLVLRDRRGVLQGILTALLLCVAILLASFPNTGGISHDLLLIEGSYSIIAAVIVGTIIGGLSEKMILQH